MKRQVLSIAFLMVLINPVLFKIGVLAHWKYNQRVISQSLCENRKRPALNCHGKCQLKKRLQQIDKQTESDETLPARALKLLKIDYYIPVSRSLPAVCFTAAFRAARGAYYAEEGYSRIFFDAVFRPPESDRCA